MLVDDEEKKFAPIVGTICDKIKQQSVIVAVYRSLERQMYCKYLNNRQLEGPAVRCSIIKIIAYMLLWK